MTTNVIQKFIASMNNSGKTEVEDLQTVALKSSPFLSLLTKYDIKAKYNFIPVNTLPDPTITAIPSQFTIGEMELLKKLKNTQAILTDETDEDTTIDMRSALTDLLASQLKMQAEMNVALDLILAADALASAPKNRNFATIFYAMSQFAESVQYAIGKFVVVTSMNSHLEILSTLNDGAKLLMEKGVLDLVPVPGVPHNKLLILHTAGCGYGLDVKGLEEVRTNNTSTLVTNFSVAASSASGFAKVIDIDVATSFN